MNITEVRVKLLENQPDKLRGFASITIDDFVVIRDLKIIEGSNGLFIAMPRTRQELADLTGTTIETAIRTMSRWQKEDVVRTEKDGFVIANRRALETAAES